MDYLEVVLGIIVLLVLIVIRKTKGKRGEMNVAFILKRLPHEDYHVINDLMLDLGGWTSQIDHVVVSRFGVFVIETKNYQGRITGGENSDSWTQNIFGHKYQFYNPVHQNESHIKALRKVLGDTGRIRMIPVIAFSNRADLHVKADYVDVINFRKLKRLILNYSIDMLTTEQVHDICQILRSANVSGRGIRKVHVDEARRQSGKKTMKIESGICPRCGGKLVQRNGKYGTFVGCSNYPKCKYTLNR